MAELLERLRARWRGRTDRGEVDPTPRGSWPERGSDRYLGGVADGLARAIDIDPLILRVALVLAAVYWPFIIVLYSLAWLLLPDERTHRSLLAGAREPGGWRPVFGVGSLGLGAAVLTPELGPNGDGGVRFGVLLFVVGLMLVNTRQPVTPGDGPAGGVDDEAADDPDADTDDTRPQTGPPLLSWPRRRSSPRPRSPRSYLGLFGLSALVVLIGLVAAVDQAWEPVSPGVAISLCLLLIGGVLLVATWRGRARLLVPAGLVLIPLWVGFAVTDVTRYDHDGDERYRFGADDRFPTELTHGYGNMEVDLEEAEFDDGDQRRLQLGLTAGRIQVDVPREVHLRIKGDVGFGTVNVNDTWHVREAGPFFVDGVDMALGDPVDACEKEIIFPEQPVLYPGDRGYPEDAKAYEGEAIYPGDGRYPTGPTTTIIEYRDWRDGSRCRPSDPAENPAELELVLDVGIGTVEVNRV